MRRLTLLLTLGLFAPAFAHYAPPLPDSRIAPPARQFGLPFAGPPGPNTWLLGQLYGNTTGAYRQRNTGYRAGQGIHFGLDFSARCGTPVVAIGDGVVTEVDGPHGSPPHNLAIDHGNGLSSFYGHLQARSALRVGTRVKRGQAIGRSGDSQFSCTGAPHLHLEIRDASHQRFFNPMPYIAADWDTLALVGGFSRGFQRDLGDPRKWQQPDRQPQARRGGAPLANFARTWPPVQGTNARPSALSDDFPGLPKAEAQALTAARASPNPKRLTEGGCCVNPAWSADSATVLFLDRPTPQSPTALYGVQVARPAKAQAMLPVAYYSPDFAYALLPGQPSLIQRVSDGARYRLDTGGNNVSWSPGSRQLAWNLTSTEGNFDVRTTRVRVSGLDSGPRTVATLYGGGVNAWLDAQTLLLSGKRTPADRLRGLETLDLRTGERRVLASALGLRSIVAAPGGAWVAYYVAFDSAERNGMFVVSRAGRQTKLDWMGSYRWRDPDRLIYVPLTPGVATHRLYEYDARTRQSRPLADLGGKISNDQWQVSPDGKRVVYVDSRDRNLWVLELPE